mmetsp:Transcript_12028/g.48417  ORF Transcript_12028/g.48417 Transcript_12028/m.48417 type:complete len:131 (+) Transcript_12028:527-919(+)
MVDNNGLLLRVVPVHYLVTTGPDPRLEAFVLAGLTDLRRRANPTLCDDAAAEYWSPAVAAATSPDFDEDDHSQEDPSDAIGDSKDLAGIDDDEALDEDRNWARLFAWRRERRARAHQGPHHHHLRGHGAA